jgi:hypothetical protein
MAGAPVVPPVECASADEFAWPEGKPAAVTLGYDDGLDSHLDVAVPVLEAQGLVGTFFVSSQVNQDNLPRLPAPDAPLSERQELWAALIPKGHEIAGHTVTHPCPDSAPFLASYDLDTIERDLDLNVQALERLGQPPPFTFAYPCSSDTLGVGPEGADFSDLVAERFLAARTSSGGLANPRDPAFDLKHVPLFDAQGKSSVEMCGWVDAAIQAGGWLMVMNHGVDPGGEYLTSSAEGHAGLARCLAEKSDDVWVATFRDVAAYISACR